MKKKEVFVNKGRHVGLFQTSCYCRFKLARHQHDSNTTVTRLGSDVEFNSVE